MALVTIGNALGSSFQSFLFDWATSLENSGIRWRYTLQRLRKDQTFVWFVEYCNSWIVRVVDFATPSRLGLITLPW